MCAVFPSLRESAFQNAFEQIVRTLVGALCSLNAALSYLLGRLKETECTLCAGEKTRSGPEKVLVGVRQEAAIAIQSLNWRVHCALGFLSFFRCSVGCVCRKYNHDNVNISCPIWTTENAVSGTSKCLLSFQTIYRENGTGRCRGALYKYTLHINSPLDAIVILRPCCTEAPKAFIKIYLSYQAVFSQFVQVHLKLPRHPDR